MGTWTIKPFFLICTIILVLFLTVIFNSRDNPQDYIKGVVQSFQSSSNPGELVPQKMPRNFQPEQPSWINLKPEEMSAKEIMDYFSWSNSSSCKLTHDFGGKMMINPSGLDGQKAICIQPPSVAPPSGSCIVYSIGINNEWSFDDAMEQYGCTVYAFDPSMNDAKDQFNRSSKIHFYKIGLGALDETNDSRGWKTLSLGGIRRLLGHQDRIIDYLKMDIEFGEWDVLPELMKPGKLDQVRQLGIEIHLPNDGPLKKYQELAGILWSLEQENGMIRFDSKANPWYSGYFSNVGVQGSYGYEIAWYNQKFL